MTTADDFVIQFIQDKALVTAGDVAEARAAVAATPDGNPDTLALANLVENGKVTWSKITEALGVEFDMEVVDLSQVSPADELLKLISRDQVVALLGEVASGRSIEAAYVCQAAGIPMVSPSSTNPKVTEIGDYIFRVCFIDKFQGELLAKFAQRTLKAKKIAVLSDVSAPYSVGLAEYFTKPFLAAGGTLTAEQKYQTKDKDFRAALTAIKATEPDAIFVPGRR